MHGFRFNEKYLSQIPAIRELVNRLSQPALASRSLILVLPVK